MPFTGDWSEAIELGLVLAAFIAGARFLICHRTGCYRLGRFRHGHYRLCASHHPHVPSNGKITKEHLEDV
jgi:hypothetical protein